MLLYTQVPLPLIAKHPGKMIPSAFKLFKWNRILLKISKLYQQDWSIWAKTSPKRIFLQNEVCGLNFHLFQLTTIKNHFCNPKTFKSVGCVWRNCVVINLKQSVSLIDTCFRKNGTPYFQLSLFQIIQSPSLNKTSLNMASKGPIMSLTVQRCIYLLYELLWTAIRCSMFLKHWDVIKLDMWSISMIHFKQEYYLGFSEKTFLHFYNFRKIYTFITDLHFPHCTKSVIMLGERHLNWMRFCSLSTFLTSKRQEVLDSHAKSYYLLF